MSRDFVHLHLHTHYSLLDGAIKIPELAQKAVEYGYKAVGMTDHGNIFGAVQFYQEMKKVGIKPIIGMEAYFTSNRFEKKGKGSEDILSDKNYHLILHAKDKTGFKNLMKLSSLAYTEGFYYKPRIDWELLEKYHEGLICQTACLKGFIPHLLARGRFDEAYQHAKRLKDIFGDDLYFEIQINGLEEQEEANKGLIELAKKLGVKLVATNDSHYLNPEDQKAHDVIKALQMKKTLKQLKEEGKAFNVSGLHFTTPEEMYKKFKGFEEALKNTVEIAEKCNVEIDTADTRGYLFPKYQIPGLDREATEEEKSQYFEKLAWEGLEKRLAEKKELSPEQLNEYRERLKYEINVIKQMGFPEYFLIVQDFINHAKQNGIPVGPGRGCLFPEADVYLADGSTIKIKDIQVGQFVITHQGNILPVINKFEYDVEEEITALKVGSEELLLTSDHKVWAVKSEKCTVNSPKQKAVICKPTCTRYCSTKPYLKYDLEWVPAGKLRAGDFVVFPRVYSKNEDVVFDILDFVEKKPYLKYDEKYVWYEISGKATKKIPRFIPFDEDFAKLLGYYISEGWSRLGKRENAVGFGFNKNEIQYAQEVQKLLEKIFDIDSNTVYHKTRNSLQVIAYSRIVGEFLSSLCGKGANNKKIPSIIVEKGKDEYVKILISYMFRGDGHDGRGNKTISIKYSTTSYKLATQLKFLLTRFGYYSSIHTRTKKGKWHDEYSVKLAGKQLLKWNEDFKDFPVHIPDQKFFRNESFFVDENYIYIKIKEVRKIKYKGKVYDISVPLDTSFVSNGFAVHNSAAGSLVAYTLGITDVDPLQHGLIFERFLNPDRISMPDIDVDFCMENRPRVIEYVKEKYGEDSVAQIITYNFMKSKMVIRDVARVLGFSYAEADKIAKMILPGPVQGSTLTIEENLEANPEFRKLYETDERVRELIDLAKKLEGLARHTGIHAAGVVIAPGPLDEYVPVYVDKDGTKATQFDMVTLENLGLVKMDFLGLKTLTELDYMRRLIKERHGRDIDFLKLPIDDENVYRLLQSGKTTGVFQLESKGMQNLLIKLKPDKFDEIIAILALFRPGPLMSGMVDDFIDRKHGRKPVEYPFEEVKDILEETYGLCLTGDTLITMADGTKKTIKEIVENNLLNEEILTLDLSDNRLKKGKITHCFDNGIKDVYKITLQNGLEIKATADHKFLTPFGWKTVKELSTEKDLLAVPVNVDIEGEDFDADKLRVLAYLLADGHLAKSSICFVNKDETLIEAFKKSVKKAFYNLTFKEFLRARDVWNIYVVSKERNEYHSNPLINWFKQLGLFHKKSNEKFIPQFVFKLNRESIGKFLAYYWDCDGYIGEKLAHIKTISKDLAFGLYSLLLRLGIKANIYKSYYDDKISYQITVYDLKNFKKHILPHMISQKANNLTRKASDNSYYSKEIVVEKVKTFCEKNDISQREFARITGIQRSSFFNGKQQFIKTSVIEKIAPVIEDEELLRLIDGDIGFVPIKEIEYAGKEHVYDIEVKGTHNFIANDIISHNCIYQEQIMFMANILSGFTMAEADTLRKAIGKKKADVMAKMKDRFISGAVERGFDKDKITKLWDDIEKFASYSFNKSHSTAYAYLTYWTAYIKTYYPEEFFAVKLSTEGNDDKFLNLLLDMEDFGIQLLPPDANKSRAEFSIEDRGKIRFGLARIKNVGEQSARDIVEEREKAGDYRDIFDISERLDSKKLNKRVLEALIKAGAFDFTGVDRGVMLASVDRALSAGQKAREQKASGQSSLLGLIEMDTQPVVTYEKAEPLTEKQRLHFEKEVLGFYLSGHPLKAYEKELKGYVTKINRLIEKNSGDRVRIAGVISDVKRKKTRSGATMAILNVQDETGIIDVRAFPDRMEDSSFLEEDRIVIIEGTVEINEEQEKVSMNASEIIPIEEINRQVTAVRFILSKEKALNGVAVKLKEICQKYSGDKDVIIEIREPGKFRAEIAAASNYSVSLTDEFKQEISKILSPEEFSFE